MVEKVKKVSGLKKDVRVVVGENGVCSQFVKVIDKGVVKWLKVL